MSVVSEALRRSFGKNDAIRDAGLGTPENIRRFDDIAYGAHRLEVLDVYQPMDADGRLFPVIVNVHGGGWVYGDKERYQFYAMNLAQRGFVVVNFSYRLAPENKFPDQLEDVCAVFKWVLSHAEKFGMDKARIFGVGDSAGANLLGLFACLCTNPAYASRFSFRSPEGFVPRGISLGCGCYTISRADPETSGQTMALMRDLFAEQGTERELAMIDVCANVTERFPPAFLFTCTGDFLSGQAQKMQAVLQKKSVPHVMRYYGDAQRELGHVFHCNIKSADAGLCNDEQCAFFNGLCR